eukprot:2075903-Rhodomonas_salina.2
MNLIPTSIDNNSKSNSAKSNTNLSPGLSWVSLPSDDLSPFSSQGWRAVRLTPNFGCGTTRFLIRISYALVPLVAMRVLRCGYGTAGLLLSASLPHSRPCWLRAGAKSIAGSCVFGTDCTEIAFDFAGQRAVRSPVLTSPMLLHRGIKYKKTLSADSSWSAISERTSQVRSAIGLRSALPLCQYQ